MTKEEFNKRVEYNGGCDRVIGGWRIIDIHLIPAIMEEYHELDFYSLSLAEYNYSAKDKE